MHPLKGDERKKVKQQLAEDAKTPEGATFNAAFAHNTKQFLPKTFPQNWRSLGWKNFSGFMFQRNCGLMAIVSVKKERDGRLWMHLSVSARKRLPKWSELREAKDVFIGKNRCAFQILPPEKEYINTHPHVLNLFAPLEGERPTPDFRTTLPDGTPSI